jgi:hypothetical protein
MAGASFLPNSERMVEISNFGDRGVERVRSSPSSFKYLTKSLIPKEVLKAILTPKSSHPSFSRGGWKD